MNENELNVTWCYPDMINLHGDRGNVMAIKRVGEILGLKVNINKIETYESPIDFENTDILLLNSGEIKLINTIVEVMQKNIDELKKYIERGKVVLAIGPMGAVFGKSTLRKDGSKISGIGILDMDCKEREYVHGDDLIFKLVENNDIHMSGNQAQLLDIKLNSSEPLGEIIYGMGNNDEEKKYEGAKYKNLIFTNCLGPVLVKNPWYTEMIIKKAMEAKGAPVANNVDEKEYDYERKALECVKEFVKKNM